MSFPSLMSLVSLQSLLRFFCHAGSSQARPEPEIRPRPELKPYGVTVTLIMAPPLE